MNLKGPELGGADGSTFQAPETGQSKVNRLLADPAIAKFYTPGTEPAAAMTMPATEQGADASWTQPAAEVAAPAVEAAAQPEVATAETAPTDYDKLAEQRTRQIIEGAKRVGGKILGFLAKVAGFGGKAVAGAEVGARAVGQGFEAGKQYAGETYQGARDAVVGGVQSGLEAGRQAATSAGEAWDVTKQAAGEAWARDKAQTAEHYQAARDAVVGGATQAYEATSGAAARTGEVIAGGAASAYEATSGAVRSGAEWARDTAVGDYQKTQEDFSRLGQAGTEAWRVSREMGASALNSATAGAESAQRWTKEGVQSLREAGGRGSEAVKETGQMLAREASQFVAEKREQAGSYIERRIAVGKASIERANLGAQEKIHSAVMSARLNVAKWSEGRIQAKLDSLQATEGGISQKILDNRAALQRASLARTKLAVGEFGVNELGGLLAEQQQGARALKEVVKLHKQGKRLAAKVAANAAKLATVQESVRQFSPAEAPTSGPEATEFASAAA